MILGISDGHDTDATVVNRDGLQFAGHEERFNRIKNSRDFPFRSIEWCLDRIAESSEDLSALAIPRENVLQSTRDAFDSELILHDISTLQRGEYAESDDSFFSAAVTSFVDDPVGFPQSAAEFVLKKGTNKIGSQSDTEQTVLQVSDLPEQLDVYHCHHHEAHARSAYHGANYDDALVVTLDGVGEGYSGSVWHAENGEMTPVAAYPYEGSLGCFYGLITSGLDWWMHNGEGKTMGLAAFTTPSPHVVDELKEYCPLYEDGELAEARSFTILADTIMGSTRATFEKTPEIKTLVDEHGRKEVASAAQRLVEEQVINIVGPWMERTNASNLATAGGIFLNVTLNQKLDQRSDVSDYFIFPAASDAGLGAGAGFAAQAWTGDLAADRMESASLGPTLLEGSDTSTIPDFLNARGLHYREPSDVSDAAVDLLVDGKIIAWCSGRNEYGPRALGNRSILIDPTLPDSKDRVNKQVKFRESWRPFAPSVLAEGKDDYFIDCPNDPFMIKSASVVEERRDEIPAVVHVDGTARPQVVTASSQPRYYDLLSTFYDRTGVPLLLNTSYNLSGDPIVCSASDAVQTFIDCGLDALVLEDYVVEKQDL